MSLLRSEPVQPTELRLAKALILLLLVTFAALKTFEHLEGGRAGQRSCVDTSCDDGYGRLQKTQLLMEEGADGDISGGAFRSAPLALIVRRTDRA